MATTAHPTDQSVFQIQEFSLSDSVPRANFQLLELNNLFCQCFGRSDHGDVENILIRKLRDHLPFFVATQKLCLPTENAEERKVFKDMVGFASWHPDGEARNGTGELSYVGWLQGIPGTEIAPLLLAAVEAHAAHWFRERKGFHLRKLFAKIPAHRVGARIALEACGFNVEAVLPKDIDDATDALYLGKYYHEGEPAS